MNTIAQGNLGNMVLTNSVGGGMGGMVNQLKQQQPGGGGGAGGMINAVSVPGGPGGPGSGPGAGGGGAVTPNQGMHMQNGPMMGRMVGQQHMLRGPHLMGAAGGAGGPGNGPGGGGPRMQTPNMQMGE